MMNDDGSTPKKKRSGEAADFKSRHASFDARNDLILENLGQSPSWILDIGSNLGDVSNVLADNGHFVLGIEKIETSNRTAASRAHAQAAFMCASVSPETIRSSVNWDAILLLSVLHRIYAFDGEETMKAVLKACGEKAGQLLIEGSTRHARYNDHGMPKPGFADHDVADAAAWHEAMFREVLGSAWSISPAVPLKCSVKEPIRLFYSLRRKPANRK